MSQQKPSSQFDKNWTWPQKTWFQQRLALVREREREKSRKISSCPTDQTSLKTSQEENPGIKSPTDQQSESLR